MAVVSCEAQLAVLVNPALVQVVATSRSPDAGMENNAQRPSTKLGGM